MTFLKYVLFLNKLSQSVLQISGSRNTAKIRHEKSPKVRVENEEVLVPYFDFAVFLR